MGLFAGADLLLADSTDLCVLHLYLNKVATSIIIHGLSPHQIPNSFHSHRQGLHRTLQVVRMLSKMQHQSPKLLRPWGRQSTHSVLQIALPVHTTSA